MLKDIYIQDYRAKIPRAKWSIGTRKGTRFFTVHWNGPRVAGAGNPIAELAQMQHDAGWHMRKGAFGVPNGADGLQYHGWTDSDGNNYYARNPLDKLWHCGNEIGNALSFAWHVPIGEGQQPTVVQVAGLFRVIVAACDQWSIPYTNVLGHLDWKATSCPGTLMPHIHAWRSAQADLDRRRSALVWYETIVNAVVREAPNSNPNNPAPIALNGKAVLEKGTRFASDGLTKGVYCYGSDTYIHHASGIGFLHESVARRIS